MKVDLLASLAQLGPLLPAGRTPSGIITVLMKKKKYLHVPTAMEGPEEGVKGQ